MWSSQWCLGHQGQESHLQSPRLSSEVPCSQPQVEESKLAERSWSAADSGFDSCLAACRVKCAGLDTCRIQYPGKNTAMQREPEPTQRTREVVPDPAGCAVGGERSRVPRSKQRPPEDVDLCQSGTRKESST